MRHEIARVLHGHVQRDDLGMYTEHPDAIAHRKQGCHNFDGSITTYLSPGQLSKLVG